MAAPSGPDIPSEAGTLWDVAVFERAVSNLDERLAQIVPQEEILDTDMLDSWKEFFDMLTFEDAETLKAEFLEFGFITPRFTDELGDLVTRADIDTPEKVFEFWLATLRDIDVDDTGRIVSFGDDLSDPQIAQLSEVLGWFDAERYFKFDQHVPLLDLHWNGQVLNQHLGGAPLVEQAALLVNLWRKLLRDISVNATEVPTVQNPYRNLEAVLVKAHGASLVDELGNTGVNGTMYRVADPDTGMVLVVKRMESTHSGGPPEVLTSQVMSEFFGTRLAGTEIIPSRYISLTNNPDEVLIVMPFFDGDQWVAAGNDFIRDDVLRRFSLLDRLTMEADAHPGNFMVNRSTKTSIAIDREKGFALTQGVDLSQDFSDMGMHGTANSRMFDRAESAWRDGGDFRFNSSDPEVVLHKISPAEVESLSGLDPDAVTKLISLDASGYKARGQRNSLFRETGIVIDDQGEAFIPTGRIGRMTFTSTLNFDEVHVSHFLTESEFKFVRNLVDEDSSLLDEAVGSLKESFSGLSDETKNLFVVHWGATDFDDAVERAAKTVMNQAEDRAQRLLDGGVINGSGGLTKHVDASTGNELRYGEVIKFTDKRTGETVEGLVINLFEASLEEGGAVSVIMFPDIGLGKTSSQLGFSTGSRTINLSEWSWGPVFEETPKGKLKSYKEAVEEFQTSTEIDSRVFDERLVPVLDANGLHVGFNVEKVAVDRTGSLTSSLFLGLIWPSIQG